LDFSTELKVLRVRLKMTQGQMAKRLGMSLNELAGIETGRIGINQETYRRLREKAEEEVAA
jgi:transcriptional regulator with XRE-family HTH domain